MKKILGAVFQVLLWALLLFLLFFILSGIYQRTLSRKPYTGFFGIGYAVVVSGSMEPAIHVDEMIIYRSIPEKEYRTGDVIVYVRDAGTEDEMLITHRLIRIDADKVITRGDHNSVEDDPVPKEDVIGRVDYHIPYIGRVVSFFRSVPGLIVTGACAVSVFVYSLLTGKRKEEDVKDEKKPENLC